MTRGRGQPTKFTPETCAKIEQAIRAGSMMGEAADYACVGRSTVNAWIARGDAYREHLETGGRHRPTEEPYLEFSEAITAARGAAKVGAVAVVRSAIQGDDVALATLNARWYLEHSDPQNWGRRTVDVNANITGDVTFRTQVVADLDQMASEWAEEAARVRAQQALAALPAPSGNGDQP